MTEKTVFNMLYSTQSIPKECRTSLSGTNCNCLLGLIEFYAFHRIFCCCINACVIREIMLGSLKLSLFQLIQEILPCKPFLPHFDCNFLDCTCTEFSLCFQFSRMAVGHGSPWIYLPLDPQTPV